MALSARALCTLELVETECGVSTGTDTARIERIIEAATRAIERFCGRSEGFHYESARVDDLKGYGTAILQAVKAPIVAITSIVYDPNDTAQTISSDDYTLDSADEGRIYRREGWNWSASWGQNILPHPLPGTEERIYRLTSECGYKTRNQIDNLAVSGTMSLPEDLEDACVMLASMRYRWGPRNTAIKSERLMGWSAAYRDPSTETAGGLPPEVADMVSSYSRIVFA